jgi:hypothetical protein
LLNLVLVQDELFIHHYLELQRILEELLILQFLAFI